MLSLPSCITIVHLLIHAGIASSLEWPSWPLDFRWSSGGQVTNFRCLKIKENSEPRSHTWTDNYFCSRQTKKDTGMRWSSGGAISGMRCTQILERSDPHTWSDNYLCMPYDAPYRFTWSSGGRIAGKSCIMWRESSDPDTWEDNFLCDTPTDYENLPEAVFPNDFKWSLGHNTPQGYDCIQINEPSDKKYWQDNHFCWKQGRKDPGMRWSYGGAISGMRCTQINEPSDEGYWQDNYLCMPLASKLYFHWSYREPDSDQSCIQWNENSDESYWQDNFLCQEKCRLTKVKILDEDAVNGVYEGTQVIGVASGGTCLGSSEHKITVSSTDSVTETVGITLSETSEVNWGISTSVAVEASAKFLGSGGSVTVGFEASVGGSYSYGTSQTEDFTTGGESSVGQETTYNSPGAAIVFGLTDRYKIDKTNTPIEMHFECPSGGTFVKDSTMNLQATTYQAAHFEAMVGRFTSSACAADNSLPDCVKYLPVQYSNFFGNMQQVRNAFQQCFCCGKGSTDKK